MYSRGDKENHEIDKYREVGNGEIAIATIIIDPTTGDKISILPVTVVNGATSTAQDTQTTLLQGIAGFTLTGFDYIGATYPDTSTEVYTYKTGGS